MEGVYYCLLLLVPFNINMRVKLEGTYHDNPYHFAYQCLSR